MVIRRKMSSESGSASGDAGMLYWEAPKAAIAAAVETKSVARLWASAFAAMRPT